MFFFVSFAHGVITVSEPFDLFFLCFLLSKDIMSGHNVLFQTNPCVFFFVFFFFFFFFWCAMECMRCELVPLRTKN